ncbi:MAG: BON domain-containing protein [Nitrospina sp.]|jgi:hyperosmotically inducible periplasmic protein|nr:BON domain-containing protein [Nitrospina sp.]MBT5653265.1 BON domain-containing protein [Nitrospina sp.]MBT7708465.1 BON domain-containing protein [Nitrospina sp.]
MKKSLTLGCFALAGIIMTMFLSSCASVVTNAAQKAWESRSTEDQVTDSKIHTGILDKLKDKDKSLLLDVNVDVWEQRVLLTGTLDDAGLRSEVESLVKQDSRIKILHNHINVVTPAEKEARRKQKEEGGSKKGEEGGAINDFWIETKIKAQLLTQSNVTSVNYFYRSVLNQVYVIGEAANGVEKSLVLSIINATEGVQSVQEYIAVSDNY